MGIDMNVVMKGKAYNYWYEQAKEIKGSMCFTSFNLYCMGGTNAVENTDSSWFICERLVKPTEKYHGYSWFKGEKEKFWCHYSLYHFWHWQVHTMQQVKYGTFACSAKKKKGGNSPYRHSLFHCGKSSHQGERNWTTSLPPSRPRDYFEMVGKLYFRKLRNMNFQIL